MAMIKPQDAGWFYVESRNTPMHFGPLIILTPPAGAPRRFVRDFVEQWRECRCFAPPFNYVLGSGRIPVWRQLDDRDIDIDHHLRHLALPAPGGERDLGILISRLHSHRLDRKRPLWECYVIEGLEGGRFAIYMKLHHSQLDGIGSTRLFRHCFSTDPDRRSLLPPWTVGMPAPRARPAVAQPGRDTKLASWLSLASVAPKVVTALASLVRDAGSNRHPDLTAPFQAPNSVLNGRISAQRRYATQNYKLSRLKRVARAAEVSANDVLLASCGGGLRRYLQELHALPQKSLVAQVPVSVRPAGDATIGNAIAFIFARLHTELADPVERLRAVHASTVEGKARQQSLPASVMNGYTLALVAPHIAQMVMGLGGRMRPPANVVISNVPGPRQLHYFNGARVDQLYAPSVLFHGQALNITMLSYADEVNIGFTACRDSLPSMQKIAVYTGQALEELEAALGLGEPGPKLAATAEPVRQGAH